MRFTCSKKIHPLIQQRRISKLENKFLVIVDGAVEAKINMAVVRGIL
ncbi:MAG: hypothetical protein WBA93_28740 [Microcoleaceae cyanobacterium]